VKIFKNIILAKVFAKILSEFLRKLKTKVMAINTQKIIFLTYSQKFLCLKIPQSHKYSNKNFNRFNQREGYSPYIEEHTLRTTKVLRQIGCSARHFKRNIASPAPSPDHDKTIELRSIDHLLFFKN